MSDIYCQQIQLNLTHWPFKKIPCVQNNLLIPQQNKSKHEVGSSKNCRRQDALKSMTCKNSNLTVYQINFNHIHPDMENGRTSSCLENLQSGTHCPHKTKEILGYGFKYKSARWACVCVCVWWEMWWWQGLASAWHSANSASCPARPSSSPCWLDILPGSARPARTRASVIYSALTDPLWYQKKERERVSF